MEGFHTIGISKIDMLQLETALHLCRPIVTTRLHIVILFQNIEDSLRIDEGIVQVIIDSVQLTDWSTDITEKHHMVHNLTDGHAWIVSQHKICRQDDNQHSTNLLQEAFQARKEIALLTGAQLQVCHSPLHMTLSVSFYRFTVERLDDGNVLDSVQNILAHSLLSFIDTSPACSHTLGLEIGDIEIDRDDTQGHQTYIDVGHEHQYEGDDGTCDERQYINEKDIDRATETCHAFVDTRLQLAGLIAC